MTIYARPFDGNAAGGMSGPYSSQQWREVWFQMAGNFDSATTPDGDGGILSGVANEFKVIADSPVSADVVVSTGAALVQGGWVFNDAAVDVTVSANATGSTRYDIIYLEYDTTGGVLTASIGIAVGTVNLPTLTQNLAGEYQIPLAYIAVPNGFVSIAATDIFDMRVPVNIPRQTKVLVQNVSGAAINYGDLVVWSTATSQAVTTVASALDPVAGVAAHYIPNNGFGYIITNGVALVKITGTVARADRLSHSATSATAATLASLTTFAIALQPSTSAVNSRILANVSITPLSEIQTSQGDLLVRNNANEIIRKAAPSTTGYPITANSSNASGWQDGAMTPRGMNRLGTMLRKTANQTVAEATATDVTWDSEIWDTDAFHSGSDAFATIPASFGGTYRLEFNLTMVQGGGASRVDATVEVKVNGSTVQTYTRDDIETFNTNFPASITLALAATDTVKLTVTMTSTGGTAASRTVVGSATTSYIALHYLGQSV